MKQKDKNSNNNYDNAIVRRCAGCGTTDEREPLFEILLPPEIVRKTPYCRACLDQVIDNNVKKNRAKQMDK